MMREPENKIKSHPVISSRLPNAFKNQQKKKLPVNIQNQSEYRQLKKLLSPLKLNPEQRSKMRQAIKQLEHFPAVLEQKAGEPLLKARNVLPAPTVQLQETITLSIVSSGSKRGIVRKVVHAPSLKLYTIKQIPISTRAERKDLIEWLQRWQSMQPKHPGLITVCGTFWNTPEGCVSVVMSYRKHGSLQQLIEAVGCIPENVLQTIVFNIIEILTFIQRKAGAYQGLATSQILFDDDFNVELSMGLSRRSSEARGGKDDVYDLGYCTLIAALGGSDWIDACEETTGQCCLLHSLIQQMHIPCIARFSNELCEFLCATLRFRRDERPDVEDLERMPWLNLKRPPGPQLLLPELLKVSYLGYSESYWEAGEQQLQRILEALKVVLVGREVKKPDDDVIFELAEEIGLQESTVRSRLSEVYNDL